MFADNRHVRRNARQYLRAEVAEPAVAENNNTIVMVDRDLRRNLKRRGQRLGKHGHVV